MHMMFEGSVYIGGYYQHFRSTDRRVVVKWLDRITKQAYVDGKRIYAPKISSVVTSDYWDRISPDDVILDWHPEWQRSMYS